MTFYLSTLLNDEPSEAPLLPLGANGQCTQSVCGTTYDATVSRANPGLYLPVSNCGDATAQAYDVWYRVVPTTTALTLRCDDNTVGLARLFLPTGAGANCSGAMQLVNCQSSQAAPNENFALGTVLFDNLTAGQTYYLAVSNNGSSLNPRGAFTLCAQAATALPVRPGTALPALSVWPNPVTIGEPLNVRLPTGLLPGSPVRVEWLSALGQVLPTLEPALQ
jgi:hypothetical protein